MGIEGNYIQMVAIEGNGACTLSMPRHIPAKSLQQSGIGARYARIAGGSPGGCGLVVWLCSHTRVLTKVCLHMVGNMFSRPSVHLHMDLNPD